jgi:hypothetical protein|nr:MAG TPA: hypothetical protein [Caudoviricetes sp.]
MQAADDPDLGDAGRAQAILLIYYGRGAVRNGARRIELPDAVNADPAGALQAALGFLNLNEPQKPKRMLGKAAAKGARLWDWDYDAPRVIADFQREYGIDLTDPALDMHWWRFWPLFRGLGDSSLTMTAMAARGADPSEYEGDARRRLVERQRELALPARTEEERLRLTSLLWGLDV